MITYAAEVVDLFAGPGGWDVAAHALNLDVVGIEWDAAACQTRRAAGLSTLGPDKDGDVRSYGPANFPDARGLIASPPCQTFSTAGKGAGRKALNDVLSLVSVMASREPVDVSTFDDERTALVLEPLRWALEAIDSNRAYEWITLEQVPPVLPVWEAIAEILRAEGYSVATGNLQAEQYGVPQTRKRAVLIARLDGEAKLPTPTHSKYYSRTPDKLDEGVLKWVSMAEALGWGMTRRPYPAVLAGTAAGGADSQLVGGTGARRTIELEREAGRFIYRDGPVTPESWNAPFTHVVAASVTGQGRPRSVNAPAPTLTGKGTAYLLEDRERWAPPTHLRSNYNGWSEDGTARERTLRPIEHLSVTLTSKVPHWVSSASRTDAVRVSVAEGAVLQSFPPDHPWQGGKSAQYQQVGNAIPPLLARAILAAVTGKESA